MFLKKSILAFSISTIFISSASFVVIVDNDNNEYEIGEIEKEITYSEWLNISESNCEFDVKNDDVYHSQSFNQIETCDVLQERTITTTTKYSNGNTETTDSKEKQTITEDKDPVVAIGTHLESTCKGIQNFDVSLPSGYYVINPNSQIMNVYCDMDSSEGGWTLISKESNGGINEALYTDYAVNDGVPSSSSYRMSKSNMALIQSLSSEMRIDCRGSDYLETASTNLFNGDGGANNCYNNSQVLYTKASFKGFEKTNITMCTWYTGVGDGAGRGCAGGFHIDEHAQTSYCGLPNYPWSGSPLTTSSTDTFALYGHTKDTSTECHQSGAERFILLK